MLDFYYYECYYELMTPREIADRALKGYLQKRVFIMGVCMAIGTFAGAAGLFEDFFGMHAHDERNNPLMGLMFGTLGGGLAVGAYDIATISIPIAMWMWRTRNDK